MALKIILADSQVIFRTGVARVLALEAEFQIVAQCDDRHTLKDAVERWNRSIVIFPFNLDDEPHELLDRIEAAGSRSILILEHDAAIENSISERAEGVVLRSVAAPQLVDCVHRVASGDRYVQRATVKTMPLADHVGKNVLARLTPKELQIIALVSEGYKNREIANQLGTKEQVIKNYLCGIYDKIGVSDRLELALYTIHHRVLADAAERARSTLVRSA